MANVLGELFGDIANAIREKTGDTATMKPAEFPSAISSIEVGGGGGTLQYKSNFKKLTGAFGERVAIDYGFKPLFIAIVPGDDIDLTKNFLLWGVSSDLGGGNGYVYGYSNKAYTQTFGQEIETTDNNATIYGADETGFNIGKTHASGYHYILTLGI